MSNVGHTMNKLITVIFLVLSFCSTTAISDELKTDIATPQQYIGYWRLIPIADNLQSTAYQQRPAFKTNCQVFIHGEDNSWLQLQLENMAGEEEAMRQCPETKEAIEKAKDLSLVGRKTDFLWQQLERKNFYVTTNKKLAYFWQIGVVEEDYTAPDTSGLPPMIKGDLVVILMHPQTKTPYWRGVLRRAN